MKDNELSGNENRSLYNFEEELNVLGALKNGASNPQKKNIENLEKLILTWSTTKTTDQQQSALKNVVYSVQGLLGGQLDADGYISKMNQYHKELGAFPWKAIGWIVLSILLLALLAALFILLAPIVLPAGSVLATVAAGMLATTLSLLEMASAGVAIALGALGITVSATMSLGITAAMATVVTGALGVFGVYAVKKPSIKGCMSDIKKTEAEETMAKEAKQEAQSILI